VKLDDGFWSSPAITKVGNEAAGVYARMLSYCGQHLTDGLVTGNVAKLIAGKVKPLNDLVDEGLLLRMGDDFGIAGFLNFNPSREDVEDRRRIRAEAGRRGGLAKAKAGATASAKANGKR
jgi:hypothetical protein